MSRKYLIACLPVVVLLFGFRGGRSAALDFTGGIKNASSLLDFARSDRDVSVTSSVVENNRNAGNQVGQVEPSSTDSILRFWLSPQTVNSEKPVANTFYFWTTSDELDSVTAQQRLLRTVESGNEFEVMYYTMLQKNSKDHEELGGYLMSGQRQRIRSAWPCYWSLLNQYMYSADESQLVEVVLKDSSLIVSIREDEKEKDRWRVFDLKGNLVPMEQVLLRKRHIAAVFYDGKFNIKLIAPRTLRYSEYYRSFILCNEDMIKSWHHAVPGLQAKILNDFNYLILLNAWFENPEHCLEQGKKGKNCHAAWTKLTTQMKISELLFATYCYASIMRSDAEQSSMKEIIDLLRDYWRKQVKPVERFPGR